MITAFRVVKEKHASDAFAGEGSRRFGGRWNHKQTTVVYLSDTLALAALEQFIHLGREGLHIAFVYFAMEIPEHVSVNVIERDALPEDWRREPPPNSTKNLGTRWVKSKVSALLRVPSAILPIGFNYIADIAHPEFKDIKISDPEPFTFDSRMWK
jgi:RES domain-containing protein